MLLKLQAWRALWDSKELCGCPVFTESIIGVDNAISSTCIGQNKTFNLISIVYQCPETNGGTCKQNGVMLSTM